MAYRKQLNPDASPQAAFGERLRRERDARGWSQRELGLRMDYSPTQISHVETGLKIATLPFCRRLDTVLGLSGTDESFERRWFDLKHGSMLEGFPGFVGYEQQAVEIRLYEVGVIPGLLQTREYAAVLANAYVERGAITDAQAGERTNLVAERQASLVRTPPPLIFVVLDEGCIRRSVGGPEVMGAQLDRLLTFAEQPNTSLQVAPFTMGEARPFDLPITVLTLPDRSIMFYAESAARGHLERDGSSVVAALTAYHQLQKHALPQADSVAMIEQVRKGTP
jgi:transcriptional regulator with XRE-family HTH domain